MSHGAAAAAPSPALPTTGTKVAEKTSPRTDDQESSLASVKQETPATVPTSPSRDELIEHVFRWVGENPKNIVPAALSHSTGNAELRKPSKQAVQPQPPSQPSAETAPFQIVQSSEPERSLPSPARPRPQPAAAENYTHETSVEISIGTLQIQVEAPPAASAKPSHRPVAPRTPNRRPVAAAQPPAIDINRLRRGFYL